MVIQIRGATPTKTRAQGAVAGIGAAEAVQLRLQSLRLQACQLQAVAEGAASSESIVVLAAMMGPAGATSPLRIVPLAQGPSTAAPQLQIVMVPQRLACPRLRAEVAGCREHTPLATGTAASRAALGQAKAMWIALRLLVMRTLGRRRVMVMPDRSVEVKDPLRRVPITSLSASRRG